MAEAQTIVQIAGIFEEALNVSAPAADVDVIESALLDSLGLITLLFEIEQAFAVEIALEAIEIEDIRTIASIARLVERAAA